MIPTISTGAEQRRWHDQGVAGRCDKIGRAHHAWRQLRQHRRFKSRDGVEARMILARAVRSIPARQAL